MEVRAQVGVIDLLTFQAKLQMPLSNIGLLPGFMHKYVIPRFVFGRPGVSHLFIPVVSELKGCIDVDDDAAVTELLMANHISDGKLRGIHVLVMMARASASAVSGADPSALLFAITKTSRFEAKVSRANRANAIRVGLSSSTIRSKGA